MKGYKKVDIIVIGGGMAGTVAAVAAARRGHKVVLLEKNFNLGGTATSGMVSNFFGTHLGGKAFIGSIPLEITNKLIENGFGSLYASIPLSSGINVKVDRVDFNSEYLKIVLEDFIKNAKAEIVYGCNIKNIKTNGVDEVVVDINNNYESISIVGKIIVDATGNANVFNSLGAELDVDKEFQPATLMFKLCDINKEKLSSVTKEYIQEIINIGMEKGKLPARVLGISKIPGGSQIAINATREVEVNHESMSDLTKGIISTKKQMIEMLPFLRENIPGFENADLSGIGNVLGIRDAKRIRGIYKLKDMDVINGTIFEDGVASCCYPVDIHLTEGGKSYLANIGGNGYYNIPYNCMITEGYGNIVATGKCISAEKAAFASLRIMGTVMAIGEATGIAAALSVEKGLLLQQVNIKELREILRKNGAKID